MKEKVKKFLKDNKNDLIDSAVIGVGFGVALCATYVVGRRLGYDAAKKDFYVVSGDIYQAFSGDRTRTAIIVRLKNSDPVILESAGGSGILSVVPEVVKDVTEG
jgi:hypothetical protein